MTSTTVTMSYCNAGNLATIYYFQNHNDNDHLPKRRPEALLESGTVGEFIGEPLGTAGKHCQHPLKVLGLVEEMEGHWGKFKNYKCFSIFFSRNFHVLFNRARLRRFKKWNGNITDTVQIQI
jgi:hypothetical protein